MEFKYTMRFVNKLIMIHGLDRASAIEFTIELSNITGDAVRLPLVNVSNETNNKIKELMAAY